MPIEKSQFTFRKFPKIRRLPEEEKILPQTTSRQYVEPLVLLKLL